jgi:hypothetical protein
MNLTAYGGSDITDTEHKYVYIDLYITLVQCTIFSFLTFLYIIGFCNRFATVFCF